MNLIAAINRTLDYELGRDERVRLIGYDRWAAYFGQGGLFEKFGQNGVIETSLSENALLGAHLSASRGVWAGEYNADAPRSPKFRSWFKWLPGSKMRCRLSGGDTINLS